MWDVTCRFIRFHISGIRAGFRTIRVGEILSLCVHPKCQKQNHEGFGLK